MQPTPTLHSLPKLKEILPTDLFNAFIEQAKLGDPDWLLDMIRESDQKDVTHPHPSTEPMYNAMRTAGLTSKDFDMELLYTELMAAAANHDIA